MLWVKGLMGIDTQLRMRHKGRLAAGKAGLGCLWLGGGGPARLYYAGLAPLLGGKLISEYQPGIPLYPSPLCAYVYESTKGRTTRAVASKKGRGLRTKTPAHRPMKATGEVTNLIFG
jgi:hypothetical protein